MKLWISRIGLSIVLSLVAISFYSSATDTLATTATFSVPGDLSPWLFTEELPTAGDGEAVSVSDWVYMISGDVAYRTQVTETGDLQSWIPATNTLITPRRTHVLVTDGQHIYAIGGMATSDGSRLSSVEFTTVEPDGSLTTWSETTPMDTVRFGPSATIYNGRLYVAGGSTSPSSWLNTVIHK